MTLQEIISLGEKSTPGPWNSYERSRYEIDHEFEIRTHNGGTMFRSTSYGNMEFDANYIAAVSPARLLPLLKASLAMREALDRIDECLPEGSWEVQPILNEAMAAFDRAARGDL